MSFKKVPTPKPTEII